MSRLPTAFLLAAAMILNAYPASAGGYYSYRHKHYGYHGGYQHSYKGHHRQHYSWRQKHYRHHKHRGHHDDDLLLGLGIVGGAIIVGSALSQPRPAPPPVVYYTPPPAPYCVQDQVYRYLPDGRIQWGTRTRCY